MLKTTQHTEPQNGQQKSDPGNKPELIAYDVRDVEGQDKAIWTRIGAVWYHKDGKGADVIVPIVPLSGRIVLREHTEKPVS